MHYKPCKPFYAKVPVVSVCAVRTGSGKSQTTRRVCGILQEMGKRVVAVRHPMPYGDLERQRVQRFATLEDLQLHECTIEEREEYEPHIQRGIVVYAGVDYQAILEQAQEEADVLVWDGGNNDTPFLRSDLETIVLDCVRDGVLPVERLQALLPAEPTRAALVKDVAKPALVRTEEAAASLGSFRGFPSDLVRLG